MIGIGEAVVTKVVTDGRNQDREAVKFTKLRPEKHVALRQEDVTHLQHVYCMHIVVILHIAPVPFVHLPNEPRKLHLVELGQLVNFEHLRNMESENG